MSHPAQTRAYIRNTRKAREILSDPEHRAFVEQCCRATSESAYAAAKGFDSKEYEEITKARLTRLHEMFDDPSLDEWKHKFESPDPPTTFFELITGNRGSISARLNEMGFRFGYWMYSKGSMALHGNTLDQYIWETTERSWVPRIADDDERLSNALRGITGHLEEIWSVLLLTKGRVWGGRVDGSE
jgi:hypothetical protein